MTMVRWDPTHELSSLQGEVNRLFNTLFDQPGNGGDRRWIPAMDLIETGDAFVLRADLPGMSEDDISLEIEDRTLTVSGERAAEHEERPEGYYRVERAFGRFERTLTLPKGVDASQVTAQFDRGVLEVRIPKPEAVRPRRIEINSSGRPTTINA